MGTGDSPLPREHDGLGAGAVRGPELVGALLGLALGRGVVGVEGARGVAVPLVEGGGHLVDLLGVAAAHGERERRERRERREDSLETIRRV